MFNSRIIKENFKEFAENTSLHGVKYIAKSSINIVEKVIWALILILSLMGSVYMTKLLWNRYTSNPTMTRILSDNAPLDEIPFPAITVCSTSVISRVKIKDFVEKTKLLTADESKFMIKTLPALANIFYPNMVEYNHTDLVYLSDLLLRSGYSEISDTMGNIVHSCGDLIRKCHWGINRTDCKSMFKRSLTPQGHCCSFNYHIIFHGYSSYPYIGATTKIVAAGRQAKLQIYATKIRCSDDVQSLSISQRKCLYPEEKTLTYLGEYNNANCNVECYAQSFYKECGCVPYYYSFSDKEKCNASKITCIREMSSGHRERIAEQCYCMAQCELSLYNVLSSATQFHFMPNITSGHFLSTEKNISNNHIHLSIFFGGEAHTILLRDIIMSVIFLISSFGGVYSLFMGCSFITVIELLYYIFVRPLIKWKLLPKIEQEKKLKRKNAINPILMDHNNFYRPYNNLQYVN